ncbi:AbiH family protein [Treponema pedis]|uniref:Bacteriophage abortive infection AbiH family protein n=1 Tax=Treponema pedis TaxID=409322 RepID=A0A7S6WP34_9SPIR|nr:AbiH family protein [Treponema pedis]QOW60708.1 bacteriophage abortive infection AbiH family protein [Treponema pedis]
MTLFIIGNGFDIHHGYDTSYLKFKEFLKSKHYPVGSLNLIDYFPVDDTSMWTDFENQLEYIDFYDIGSDYVNRLSAEMSDKEYERAYSINSSLQDSFEEVPKIMNDALCHALSEFLYEVEQEKIKKPKSYFDELFNHDDIFITFNYTNLLEELYNINSASIKHIHGIYTIPHFDKHDPDLKYNEPSIIFGHGNFAKSEDQDLIYEYNPFEPHKSLKYVNQQLKKNYQINQWINFIRNNTFTNIEIIGHNLGVVDAPYFKELNKIIDKSIKIYYWLYNQNEENQKKETLKQYFIGHKIEIKYYP